MDDSSTNAKFFQYLFNNEYLQVLLTTACCIKVDLEISVRGHKSYDLNVMTVSYKQQKMTRRRQGPTESVTRTRAWVRHRICYAQGRGGENLAEVGIGAGRYGRPGA